MSSLSLDNSGVLRASDFEFELTSDGVLISSVVPTLKSNGELIYPTSSPNDKKKRNKRFRMYIAKPNRKTQRNLAGVESAKFRLFLKDICEIKFEINKYVTNKKGQIKENPVYDLLGHSMEINVENIGWFRINTTPEENYSSSDGRWYKTFTAYGYETTLQDIDLVGIKVNCGTDDSLEMFEENLNELGIPNHNIQLYIKEENEDPSSDKYWMLGLLNILEHEYLSKKGWNIGVVETGISSLKGRQFDIDNMNVYRFLTNEIPSAYKCMPIFDRVNKVINFVKLDSLGKDLNIELNLRNFINDIDVIDRNDDYYNRFRVYGNNSSESLIEYINYGSNKIENLNYAFETRMLDESTKEKYYAYKEFVDSNREEYANYTKLFLQLSEERSNLYDLVPVEEADVLFTNVSDDELEAELLHFQTIVSLLEELHTIDGELKIEGTNDYALYISSKEIMIPKIQAEIDARLEGKHSDTFDYSTNWELYGINELETRKTAYNYQIDVLAEKGYDKEWTSDLGISEELHNKQHALYLEYVGYMKEINIRLESLNERVAEIEELIEINTASQNELAEKAKIEHEIWGFTESELSDINIIYRDTDFQDSTIEILETDTIDDIISLAWDLFNSANEQLEIESCPQLAYEISLDNFFRHTKFSDKANNISLGDFCWLGLDNGFHTRQRIVEMEYELVNSNDNNVKLVFSDMVTVCGKADDYRFILESNSSSTKNTLSRESQEYISNTATTIAAQMISKYFSGGNSYFTYGISAGDVEKLRDALDGLISGELSLDELKVKLAQIDTLQADSAFVKYLESQYLVGNQADFQELQAKLIAVDNLLAGNISAELEHVIHLTAENVQADEAFIKEIIASQIMVSDLRAGNIILNENMQILSENGFMVMNGETMQIMGIDSEGNQYVAIQLGYDSNGNPSLIITDENGSVMLDGSGLHEGIVPNGLIKNNMIADKAIGKEKLSFAILEPDEDGTLNAAKVKLDGEGLDVVLSSMKEEVNNIQDQVVSVVDTDFIYYSSTSSSELSGGEWSTDRPVWENGKYIWSKTITTYSDGSTSETKPICVTGFQGMTGEDGSSQYLCIKYSNDGRTFSGNIVSADIDDWENGQYNSTNGEKSSYENRIRFKELSPIIPSTTYKFTTNLTSGVGFIVRSYDENKTFLRNIGVVSSGKTIISAEDEYFYGITMYSGTLDMSVENFENLVSDGFKPDIRDVNEIGETVGDWIGMCISENESDITDFDAYTWKKIVGNNGMDGLPGMGVQSISEQYYLSSSKETLVGGEWTADKPIWEEGTYIWTRLEIKYENPETTVYTTPMCDPSWDALDNLNNDIIEAKDSIEKARVDIDNVKKEIELSVIGDTVTSVISTMKSDIENVSAGVNKWLIEIYPKSILDENYRDNIDFLVFYGNNINPTIREIINDSELSTAFNYGNDYVGYGLTFIQVGEDVSIDVIFNKTVKGTLFLNGVRKSNNTTTEETLTLNFKQGWNVLEVIWNVDTNVTSGGFSFNQNLSESENCLLMNCYYRTITGRECFMQTQTASISIGLNTITSTVSNIESTLDEKAESDTVNDLSEQISTVSQTFNDYMIQVSKTYATLEGLEEINSSVMDIKNNMITTIIKSNEFSSIIEQTREYWRTQFESEGAVCGSTTINADGILVEGADESVGIIVRGTTDGLYESRMTPLEFSGWYNGEKVFYLNEDETVTERIYVNNGISLNHIKIIPIEQDGVLGIDFLGTTANLYS